MNNLILFMTLGLSLVLVVATLVVWLSKDLLVAILGSAVVSLVASIFFLILQAPDVAITEAAIGAGLTTGILLYAMKKAGRYEDD